MSKKKEKTVKTSAGSAKQAASKKDTKNKTKQTKKILKFKIKYTNKLRKPIIITGAIIGLFLLFQIASLIVTFEFSGKAMPGTNVAGIDIGGLTLDEIQQKLMEKGQPYLETPIQITLDNHTQEFLPAELGISLLPRNTLQEVEFVRFGKTNIFTITGALWKGRDIPFYVSIDTKKAVSTIESKFNFDERKAKNAKLAFDEEGGLTIIPEKQGEVIDVRTLYQEIKNRAHQLSSDPVVIKTNTQIPLVTKDQVEAELENVQEILYREITLAYDYWEWDIRLIDHINWIEFDYKSELKIGEEITLPLYLEDGFSEELPDSVFVEKFLWIKILDEPFTAYVNDTISPELEIEAEDVKIYTDENEEIIIEGKGENGREIKKNYFITALELATNNEISYVPIPVYIKKAHTNVSDDLKMLGIETLLGTGHSAFAGSPANRVHNIGVGVNRFNTALIPPGEEFSFNEHLGTVDASTGYRPELVIKAEGTVPEYGGGLCQVSSTMYRAALMSGLPITEREPHSYAVSYYAQIYGYGLDSTIYPGVRDLKFVNDTAGHILVQSYVDGTHAYFKFYGTDDGRTVDMEGPYLGNYHGPGPAIIIESASLAPGERRQVENAHTGFNATWYRYLTKDGETTKETIFSQYKAIPAKIMVGAGGE